MIRFACERVGQVRAEVQPLLELHWQEIAHDKDIPLDVDWDAYEAASNVRVFTARSDGSLIGYGCFVVAHNKHYRQSKQAVQDVLFIHPEHRRGMTGYRFIQFCDDQLRDEGVQKVVQHVKRAHDFGTVLERQHYELVETIWAKRLDRH